MRIFIIGFMGSGKSTVGKELAGRLGYRFIDMDQEIERDQGMSINEIFNGPGETFFREMESKLLKQLIKLDDIVVSTGGGVPCNKDNMEIIKTNGISIYLEMSPEAILSRLKDASDERPLIKDKDINELEMFGLILTTPSGKGVKGQTRFITLGLEADKVRNLIENEFGKTYTG